MTANHPSPFHKYLVGFFIITIISLPGLGCARTGGEAKPTPQEQSAAATVKEAVPGEQAGEDTNGDADSSQARFVDEPGAPVAFDLPSLGSTSFRVDSSNQVTGEFPDAGKMFELQLTDGAGLTWTLTVPDLALATDQTITMTALADLQSGDIPGDWAGGVLLEPDGLAFLLPAALSVSGPALKGTTLILSGNHDGSQMNFTLPVNGTQEVSASILHFSAYSANNTEGTQINEMANQAVQQYKALSEQARKILKNPNIDVPRPPSIPVRCPEDEDEAKENEEDLQDFIKEFQDPEYVMIGKLLAVKKNLELLGEPVDSDLETRLLNREVKKVRLLIAKYGQQAENLRAITSAGLMVAKDLQLLGDSQGGDQTIMKELAAMFERAHKELLDELINEHEYRNVDALLEVARGIQLLGNGSSLTVEQVLRQLEAAMQFELDLTYNLEISGDQFYTLQAIFPVKLDGTRTSLDLLKGTGTGNLISYENTQAPEITLEAAPFSIEAYISEFDPCSSSASLSFSQFSPQSETYQIDEDFSQDVPIIQNSWRETFTDYYSSDSLGNSNYLFPLKLRSGDEEAANEEIEAVAPNSQGKVEGTFAIKLTHKPKRGN